MGAILGGAAAVLLLGGGGAAWMMMRGGGGDDEAPPVVTPVVDTAKLRADSIAAAAQAAFGVIRLLGDIPEDATILLDGEEQTGPIMRARPGGHDIEIQSEEFEPWEGRATVRGGDTVRIRVEMVLKSDSAPGSP